MTVRHLKAVSDMSPADLAMQREAEARQFVAQEAVAIEADARALVARCEQYTRLNSAHPGFRNATVDLLNALRLKAPPLNAILQSSGAAA